MLCMMACILITETRTILPTESSQRHLMDYTFLRGRAILIPGRFLTPKFLLMDGEKVWEIAIMNQVHSVLYYLKRYQKAKNKNKHHKIITGRLETQKSLLEKS